MNVNLKSLIEKLTPSARNALEAAAGLCVTRTHYDVEVEHYLMKLLDEGPGDFEKIRRRFGVDDSRLTADLTRSLDALKSGNARTPAFSPTIVKMLSAAWQVGSLEFGHEEIRTGATILALVSDPELARMTREISKELSKIDAQALQTEFGAILAGSPEDMETAVAAPGVGPAPAGGAARPDGKKSKLDQFTIDLTANARAGKVDPVLGRDREIRQVVDILMRRRQNNPILTGEAGVGKTAVVEGFALRVAAGDVPLPLQNVAIRSLDLALLQAGAGIKGEFENRLKGLIEEVKSSPTPIILFIDEAHTMIGAGGQEGQGDAANLLKPALARGELRTLAATTWSEYKKYFEKDAALARRFQVVKVEEPEELQCMVMLRGIAPALEKHHGVRILEEAVQSAVRLSHRYMVGRQLPDKAVSVLDTACARLALGHNSTPPPIEDATRRLDDLAVQERILKRESSTGADHAERLEKIATDKAAVEAQLATLREHFEKERELVGQIRELRSKLEGELPPDDATAARSEVAALNATLDQLQGEQPLMRVCVDSQTVGEVIAAWTGIPLGKMLKDEVSTVLELEHHLGRRVIGQAHALAGISERIRTARASLDDPGRPIGVFLLAGPSGVGKTETALALSDLLYGGEKNLISINMSEFQESHTVSTLKGSPPGYVGYGEGGVLTEAVRRRPYAVVLLDEVEKAHPDVLELFYQVFDKGIMEDGEGREIDFKNTIIILTSNAGTDTIMKLTADLETAPTPDGLVKALKPELNKIFKPAFLGRLVIIPYYPIRDEALKQIIVLKLAKIQRRLEENHKIKLSWDPALLDEVASRCTEVESGARNVDNILTNSLLPDLARRLLGSIAGGAKPSAIHIRIGENGAFEYS
ncbi:MAG: type VI secretion system ATPase TssH [Bryobacteraceae bacterium]